MYLTDKTPNTCDVNSPMLRILVGITAIIISFDNREKKNSLGLGLDFLDLLNFRQYIQGDPTAGQAAEVPFKGQPPLC